MRQEERLSLILERPVGNGLRRRRRACRVARRVDRLGAPRPAAAREQRLLSRTHGGAVANSTAYELPLRYEGGRHSEEKRRIAAVAAARVDDPVATVGLTGGTTTTEVARQLAERAGLTIVTNALNIAAELAVRPNLKLIVTGGDGAQRVLRTGRAPGRGRTSTAQPRSSPSSASTASPRRRPDHLPRRRGAHQQRPHRARPPRDRRRRRVQDRPARLRAHLRESATSTS